MDLRFFVNCFRGKIEKLENLWKLSFSVVNWEKSHQWAKSIANIKHPTEFSGFFYKLSIAPFLHRIEHWCMSICWASLFFFFFLQFFFSFISHSLVSPSAWLFCIVCHMKNFPYCYCCCCCYCSCMFNIYTRTHKQNILT